VPVPGEPVAQSLALRSGAADHGDAVRHGWAHSSVGER
jgi:hypothetical protein